MKKVILIYALCLYSNLLFGQQVEKITSEIRFRVDQSLGIREDQGEYTFTVSYDKETFKFKGKESNEIMDSFSILKTTDNYIIGKNSEEEHLFYNIKQKKLYVLINFENYFIVGTWGSESNEFRQTVYNISDMLKNKKSQKDVIQYLIEQSTYDF